MIRAYDGRGNLGPRGITANTISAGPTDTDLLRNSAARQALDGAAAMTALGRIGQPDNIANVVALIARPGSGWMTGQNIRADGGLSLHRALSVAVDRDGGVGPWTEVDRRALWPQLMEQLRGPECEG